MSSTLKQRKKAADTAKEPEQKEQNLPGPTFLAIAKTADGEDWLLKFEKYVPFVIFLICAFTRYYRLDRPGGVVFDEFHFGRFTNQYHMGTYLFDIHPPLGKLVLYFVGKFLGYDHRTCAYLNISDTYGPECKYFWLRATASFFGSLTAPVIYQIVRNFGGSLRAGVLAALLFICDGLNLTESRLILIDSQLIFWCGATLLVAQFWWAAMARHTEAVRVHWETKIERPLSYWEQITLTPLSSKPDEKKALARLSEDADFMHWKSRAKWILAMGVVCANCVSIKYTGLATPAMIALESFFALFFLPRAMPLPDLFGILISAFFLFSFYFRVHFGLLPNTGDGDAFMPIEFQRTLVNNTHYDPNAVVPGFWPTMMELNREMVSASARIEQRHHWDSLWWEWPLNLRGILYYSVDKGNTYSEHIYLLGNPTVIWPVCAVLVLSIFSLGLWARYRTSPHMKLQTPFSRFFAVIGYCLIVYILNLLPYVWVSRSCFIYHYMPALFYAHIITALMTDKLAGAKWMPIVLQLWSFVIIAGYLIYAPWVYSFPLTYEGHSRRRWLPRWD